MPSPRPRAFPLPDFPALTSDEYTAAFNEVRVKGALDAEVSDRDGNGILDRTDDETEIGIFWGYDHRLGSPVRIYNEAARVVAQQQGNSVSENARLLALLHLAMADAGIAAWNVKYEQNIWRPIVGIREAADDGNPGTPAEPDWVPLGAPLNNGDPAGHAGTRGLAEADPDPSLDGQPDFTPPFPSYTSGHATFGTAAFTTLTHFYGTDAISFQLYSEDSGTTRNYSRFSEAEKENDESRVFLGVHWRTDCQAAHAQGEAVADFVSAHFLKPLHPWHNWVAPVDTTADSAVTANDALVVINYINQYGQSLLPGWSEAEIAAVGFLDVNADDWASPEDVLMVVNEMNRHSQAELLVVAEAEGDVPFDPQDAGTPTLSLTRSGDVPPTGTEARDLPEARHAGTLLTGGATVSGSATIRTTLTAGLGTPTPAGGLRRPTRAALPATCPGRQETMASPAGKTPAGDLLWGADDLTGLLSCPPG